MKILMLCGALAIALAGFSFSGCSDDTVKTPDKKITPTGDKGGPTPDGGGGGDKGKVGDMNMSVH